jgi:iron complex transport system substrate-binding protein
MFPPDRIVCLTEETVETLYLLGEQDRIVGISGYVVRPPQARREKPRVSAFTSANIDKIVALKPDLVLTFSDLQAASPPISSAEGSTFMLSTSEALPASST